MSSHGQDIDAPGLAFWSKTREEALMQLGADAQRGLTQDEASRRLKRFGLNQLAKQRTITFWGVFKEEVREPMILLLLVVGVVYGVWGEARDAITIFLVVAALVFTEIFTEYRAKKAVAALRKLTPSVVPVMRDGAYMEIPTIEVVVGDLLVLEIGTRVPADARVIHAFGLEADESPLTGESVPVAKQDGVLRADTVLAERSNMVFAGTTITRGRGTALVTATGMETELGKITGLVLEAKEPKTPLQLAMKQLAGLLVWVAVGFSVLIPGIGILQGKPLKDMILTGLSLSFATIPEELPIVITMVLGVGALALSRSHVLIRRLRAAETLGGVTVVVTDKTGTLTENKMTLARIATDSTPKPFDKGALLPADLLLLKIGALASGVKRGKSGEYVGDPLEVALLRAAEDSGMTPEGMQKELQRQREFSFDNQRKLMSSVYRASAGYRVFVKGAPEAVLEHSSRIARNGQVKPKTPSDDEGIHRQVADLAREAMRVIALAYKETPDEALTQEQAESDLIFAGLVGLHDPPRPGVADAVRLVTEAGIRIIVVSGDHPLTVERIALEVGIPDHNLLVDGADLARMDEEQLRNATAKATLFARISAEQKLRIVSALHERGEVVAVTGDGINDAPALKSADIGIAMGETGTEVAREAANMILTDDSFNSIAAGVREGRKIFDNLKKGITYYLSVKVALVVSFIAALILSIPFPFAPIQIILLELFMDLAASATFVAEPIEQDAMTRPPRSPKEKFVNRAMLGRVAASSLSLAAAVTINYLVAFYGGRSIVEAQTIAFATWLIGHIYLALTMRSERQTLLAIGPFANRVMLVWGAAAIAFLVIVTSIPEVRLAVKVSALDWLGWLMALGVPFVTVFWMELWKLARR